VVGYRKQQKTGHCRQREPRQLSPRAWRRLCRGCGRGLLLIRTFMDEVRHNPKGNEITMIKKAVDLDPANGAYLDSLGWAYFRLGKYDLAEESLTKASQHIGSDPTVQDHLGDLYQKTGRLKLAATHWERALNEWNKTVNAELDPNDVAKVQKKLESAKVKLAKKDSGNK